MIKDAIPAIQPVVIPAVCRYWKRIKKHVMDQSDSDSINSGRVYSRSDNSWKGGKDGRENC